MHISRPSTIHKKLQSPQSHISQAIHCSLCLADSHAPRILIRAISPYGSRGSSMPHTSSKNPIPIPPRPAFRSSHIPNQNPQIHVRTCTAMARAIPPRPATGLRKCASDRSTQIPCADEGGMGVRVRRRFAMRRRRRSGGLHSSPPGGGQLRVGTCVSFPGVCHTAASGLR